MEKKNKRKETENFFAVQNRIQELSVRSVNSLNIDSDEYFNLKTR